MDPAANGPTPRSYEPMRIKRGLLFWGIVLIAIGGVLVAADLGGIDTATLADALRLWPLAVIAVGAGIVLRRTRAGLPTLVAAALIPGIVLGSAFAIVPRFAGDCATRGEPRSVASADGSFTGPASVSLRSGCGSLTVATGPGSTWQLDTRSTSDTTPNVVSTDRSLTVGVPDNDRWNLLDGGRDEWDLTLPANRVDDLSVAVLAGAGRIDLPGAHVDHLALTANAAAIAVDASEAAVAELTVTVDVGSVSIRLPGSGDLDGSVRVGAGEVRICAPPDLGLRITSRGTANSISVNGLQLTAASGLRVVSRDATGHVEISDPGQGEAEWQSPGYASATHHADLRISANFGAVDIDPIGGCE
jgi:hypothetical protein